MYTADPGGLLFTYDPARGGIVPADPNVDLNGNPIRIMRTPGTDGSRGESKPPPIYNTKSPGYTQGQVDASLSANPQAAGSNGSLFSYQGSAYAGGSSGPTDYSQFLSIYGLPPDVQSKVNAIFAQNGDVSQATALAMAYVRGTTWYDQTYPGIKEGIARGIVSNEADYRNYLNSVNTFSKQYLGRDISSQELAGYLQQGFTADRVGRIYAGSAIASVNGQDWQNLAGAYGGGELTDTERKAFGEEQAGIDTELGQRVQRRLSLAQQRLQTAFGGSLASPGLSIAGGRLRAAPLGATDSPDIAA